MSRNSKYRYMAEQLPPFPKLKQEMIEVINKDDETIRIKKNMIQDDGFGRIIYVNHFKELKKIEDSFVSRGYSKKSPEVAKAFLKYQQMVLAYDKRKKPYTALEKATIVVVLLIVAYSLVTFLNHF